MRYAIVDIETTGGYAAANAITEIGICISDGEKVIDEYHTLLKPDRSIPQFIETLTGINDDMVAHESRFEDLAAEIDEFLKDAVFVAHNVGFDYSFLKKQFDELGIPFQRKKLCTVRLSRKVFPGLHSYSLSNLCSHFNLFNENPHRALGDARVTADLFAKILAEDKNGEVEKALKRGSGEDFLPTQLDATKFHNLPEVPGVYYFLNSKGEFLYIGKAKNIKTRVRTHFGGSMKSAKKQQFLKEITDIKFELTGNEFIALLLEDCEIKAHWPKFNLAQKNKVAKFGVFQYSDRTGTIRLGVQKLTGTMGASALKTFFSAFDARNWLFQLAEDFKLSPKHCGLPEAIALQSHNEDFQENMQKAIESMRRQNISVFIKGEGRNKEEQSFVWIEEGTFRGFGFVSVDDPIDSIDDLKGHIDLMPNSPTADNIAFSYLAKSAMHNILPIVEELS